MTRTALGGGSGRRHRDSPRVRRLARQRGIDLSEIGGTGPSGRVTITDVERLTSVSWRDRTSAPESTTTPAARRHRDSPRVRRLAREHGVDLRQVAGTGPGGRVTIADFGRSTPVPPLAEERTEVMTSRQRVLAGSMLESLRVAAQATATVEVDLTRCNAAARRLVASSPGHDEAAVAFAFIAESAVQALVRHPVLNARVDLAEGVVTHPGGVHLAVGVDTLQPTSPSPTSASASAQSRAGLLFPVVHDAQNLSVQGVMRRIAEVVQHVQTGVVTPDDLAGGTFTITDIGRDGMLFSTPIIVQPQSAILAVGSVVRRPTVVTDGEGNEVLAIRSIAYLSLTYDHRIIDGGDAARYLETVKVRLESPATDVVPH